MVKRAALAVLVAVAVAIGGWSRAALSGSGAVAATMVGAVTFGLGGLEAALALVAFFFSGSWLSRRARVRGELEAAKGHRRDAVQVLANGGCAALAAGATALGADSAYGGVVGAVAAAAADTWASEIGVRSKTPPRSVLTGRIVAPGTSGGVTPLGWLAATGGAMVVTASYLIGGRGRHGWGRPLLAGLGGGLLGTFADSLAGATVQASYRCVACGAPSETPRHTCGGSATLVRGSRWVTNDTVNLIGTSVGGASGALAWWAIGAVRHRGATPVS